MSADFPYLGWSTELPQGWFTHSLKYESKVSLSNVDKHSHEDEVCVRLCNYTDVYYNDYISDGMELMVATATEHEIRKFTLLPNDVIITKDSETANDIAMPSCVAEELTNVVCGYHMAILRPDSSRLHGPYLMRALQSDGIRDQFHVAATGITRVGISFGDISNALVPLPPLETQRHIATYLDRKTQAIDALIAKKKRLMELLEEKRSALINHVVTKGLDPDAPMKDSGVPWIGRVPGHWGATTLKWVSLLIQTGPFGSQLSAEEYVEDGAPVINPSNIRAGALLPDRSKTVSEEAAIRLVKHQLHLGDVVLGRRGEMGRYGLVRSNEVGWICGTGSLVVRLKQQVLDSSFFGKFLEHTSVAQWLELQAVGSTMFNLNTEIVGSTPVLIPPVEEQRHIATYLDQQTSRTDTLRDSTARSIEKLKEYRQALITAAVTGKIDVTHDPMSDDPEEAVQAQLNLL